MNRWAGRAPRSSAPRGFAVLPSSPPSFRGRNPAQQLFPRSGSYWTGPPPPGAYLFDWRNQKLQLRMALPVASNSANGGLMKLNQLAAIVVLCGFAGLGSAQNQQYPNSTTTPGTTSTTRGTAPGNTTSPNTPTSPTTPTTPGTTPSAPGTLPETTSPSPNGTTNDMNGTNGQTNTPSRPNTTPGTTTNGTNGTTPPSSPTQPPL